MFRENRGRANWCGIGVGVIYGGVVMEMYDLVWSVEGKDMRISMVTLMTRPFELDVCAC